MPPYIKQRAEGRFFNLFRGMAQRVTQFDQGGDPRWGTGHKFCTLAHLFLLFCTIFASDRFLLSLHGFANKHSTMPQLNLVNRQSLDKILRYKV